MRRENGRRSTAAADTDDGGAHRIFEGHPDRGTRDYRCGTRFSCVTDDLNYRVSDGLLLAPFADSAVAVDLIGERAHVLGPVATWLLSQPSPVDIADLAAEASTEQQEEVIESILDALDTLRTPGLINRNASYEFPEPPGDSTAPEPGAYTGRTHLVINRRIAFRSDDESIVTRIDSFLGGGTDETASRFFDVVIRDGLSLFAADQWRFENLDQLLFQLPTVLNDDAARTHGLAVIHTGAVRTPDGRVVLLTGPPNAGKSTLTAALVAAGCDYLGDESIGIDMTGAVHGYPKPLTLRSDTREILGIGESDSPHVDVGELRADALRVGGAARVDEILLVRYDPNHTGPLRSAPLDRIPAIEAVIANVLNLARGGEAGLEALCQLVESVPVVPFAHAGVETAVPAILES